MVRHASSTVLGTVVGESLRHGGHAIQQGSLLCKLRLELRHLLLSAVALVNQIPLGQHLLYLHIARAVQEILLSQDRVA